MKLTEIDYELPKELIAHRPVEPRDKCRLMVVDGIKIEHKIFTDILDCLDKDDVLVINETKVNKCKILGKKATGSPAEIILTEKIDNNTFKARIRTNYPKIGNIINLPDGLVAEIIGRDYDTFTLRFNKDDTEDVINKYGEFPFPTYIKRSSLSEKEYQTIYAKEPGSVAAPTAGLHFTEELLERISQKGVKIARVCLHIDFGTFFEIKEQDIEKHKIHSERFEITKENADMINKCIGKLIAVGTTSVRVLESAADDNGTIHPTKSSTEIYIYPGYRFKSKISAMITNFHLPRSTLLLLVYAFAGTETMKNAYELAVKEKYRFYSLGDGMLLFKENSHPQ